MKKLRVKVFVTIFTILTVFIIGVFSINTISEYSGEINSIDEILTRNRRMFMPPMNNENRSENDFKFKPGNNNSRPVFVNYNVYTVLLDDDGKYQSLLNDSSYEDEEKESAIKIAKEIIENHKTDKHVSNLLFEKYSYSFNNNMLTIVDNSYQTASITSFLIRNLFIFIILEVIVYFISSFLTKWISSPVEESFEREKRFLADASHELKTPIAVIMASADAYSNDKDNKWIDNIKDESDIMNKLVRDLLDLARLEKDSEIIKKEENLSKIIEKFLLSYESLFFENNIKFDYDIKEDIIFKCNSDSIKELLSILIDNAIKYSDKKGIVKVNLYKDKDIILEVTNKGIPIKEEDKEKIFERFYKVDKSRNRKSNNYGLGLSIAKKIVDLHDGKIEAYSKDGFTTFKINFNQK